MSQTEPRPYVSIYVAIDTPDAPRLGGKPVRSVSWTAHRFSHAGSVVEFGVYAHHGNGQLTRIVEAKAPATPDVPDWVPRPPAGWLASLKMTEPVRPASPLMAGGVW